MNYFDIMSQLQNPNNGLLSRKAAWEVLRAVSNGSFADIALERIFKKYSLSRTDRALVTELSYGAIRQRYFLDCWLDFLGKIPAEKQPPLLRWLLHIGLYQILKMERIPPSAAIYSSVELAKRNKLLGLAPVVNGLLRSALRCKKKGQLLPKPLNDSELLAQEESLPFWLAKELISWRGKEGARKIARVFNTSPTLDLRVNSLLINKLKLKKIFESVGIRTRSIPNCPQGLEVIDGEGDLKKWPGFSEGHWFVQDRSSQLIAKYLSPKSGEKILDACAAPGGKTTHIAELIRDNGEIWAIDRSSKRIEKLLINLERLSLASVKTKVANSIKLQDLFPEFKEYFDRILIDAPCSGLGTLSRHPDARWRMSPEKIMDLVFLQKELLNSLVPLLKKGGLLLYSTCTIHPDENSHQIKQFLIDNPNIQLTHQHQIWPDEKNCGDGFYFAILES